MNSYPEYAEVNGKKYKINTDFRVAIKCNEIAQDETIGDYERSLAIIYILFGEEALNDYESHNDLLQLALKYLTCGQEMKDSDEQPDMDFVEDYAYIKTSFRSDYGINLDNEKMHWWEFWNLMNGLSNSELGNCCILNRIRNLRNFDVSEIKDDKERQKIIKAKKDVELRRYKKEEHLTKEQEKSMEELNKLLGL
jgi:hypothetical protein